MKGILPLRIPLVLAALAFTLTPPANALTTEPQPEASEPAAEKPKPKKSCRVEGRTASRVGLKKICRTPEEWAKIDAANRERRDREAPIG